ncbi:hypothetical protein JZ751_017272 [Albula glossodonta]|uniref:Ras suppressor protein 1 n=1 Tax=Albula glossodonta TaxID=121402 RepID=A0A8T2MTN8_9TELE|nr:hypothetical protein JZ751_017272 [Albula glossodonta]
MMCLPRKKMSKSLKKIVEESREKNLPEVDMCDRGVSNMLDIPGLFTLSNITQLVLSHNKLTTAVVLCGDELKLIPGQRLAVLWGLAVKGNVNSAPVSLRILNQAFPWRPSRAPSLARVIAIPTALVSLRPRLPAVPPNIADLKNLEVLNIFNNQIEELPTQISSLQKLKHLNLGMNRMSTLPRGFGSLPALEVLDLTYNNLNESSLPGNFFYLTTLRALYLSDNDFEMLPPDIGKLAKLQITRGILGRREEGGEAGPRISLGHLHRNLDLTGPKQVFKAENNPWVTPIADQFQLGVSHVFEYVRSETYKYCLLKGRVTPEWEGHSSDGPDWLSEKRVLLVEQVAPPPPSPPPTPAPPMFDSCLLMQRCCLTNESSCDV